MKILVTGANGHLGEQTIDFLIKKGVRPDQLTAMVRSTEKGEKLAVKGVRIVIGDYDDPDALTKAFVGIDKLFLISATDLASRLAQHIKVIAAAKATDIKQIVYTSGARTIETPDSVLWSFLQAHLETERELEKSGIAYTILRNGLYLDTIPLFIGDVLSTGMIYLPAGQGRIGWALRSEMAEAAAQVLTSANTEGKHYDLVNTETYSYQDVANMLSGITGRAVNYVSPTKEEFVSMLAGSGVVIPEEYISIILAQAQGEGNLISNDLADLLGRKPTTLLQYLDQVYGS